MAGGKLTVEIGADITDFEKKIKEVEFDIKELSKVKLDRLKLGLDTTEINSQIKDAKNNLTQLKTAVKDTGQSFASASPKVVNAGNTLTQFSRIAQDAPFGIIGIGNNITATAESFSYLKAQTGSTGGALKALASSLAGSGGILLGVSLLTTGLTLLAQSGLTVGDVIDKITGNFDAFGAELNKISVDAAKNSGQEIAGLNALISVAQDDVNSRKDRLIAVEELQSKYPGYFGNLTKEQILTGDLTAVTKELSKAIIARAEASAIADKIGELAAKKLDLQIQKEKELVDLQKAQTNVKQANENLKIANNIAGAGQRAAGAAGALALSASRVKDLNEQILAIQTQQDRLAGKLNQKTEDSINLLDKKDKVTKTFATPTVTGVTNAIIPAPLFDVNGIATFNGQVDEFGNKIKTLPGIMQTSLAQATNIASTELAKFNLMWQEFGITFSEILETGIETALTDFGTAIGNSLVNGLSVLETIGASLLSSIGNTIKAVGTELVKMGVLAQAYAALVKWMKKAFKNPYALAAAGVALVVIGSAISASASRVASGGGGGGASSSSGAGANNQSFSSSGFSGGGGGGTVVFEISGQKLIGVLSNTINANRRLGGTLGLG
jgi:hypothetical protein